jgi:hypothetical protein
MAHRSRCRGVAVKYERRRMTKASKPVKPQLGLAKRTANPKPTGKDQPERRQFLSYMRPDLIISLKLAAIEDGRPAYELAEEAVDAYLKARKPKK